MPPEIVREPAFDDFMRRLARNAPRLLELDAAIDWALSRDPTFFTSVTLDYYLWRTTAIAGIPAIEILYRYDKEGNRVFLIRGRVVDETAN